MTFNLFFTLVMLNNGNPIEIWKSLSSLRRITMFIKFFIVIIWLYKSVLIGELSSADLREDKHFLADHPGATPITTAQACHL